MSSGHFASPVTGQQFGDLLTDAGYPTSYVAPLTAANSYPGITGQDPTLLPNWRKGLARQRLGIGNATILCLGDSTTVGTGSVPGIVGAGIKTASYPSLLAKLLTSAGVTAGSQNCFGDFGYGASAPTYDARVSLGSWAYASPVSMGGQTFAAGGTTASPLTFTPSVQTNTCEIYYLVGSTGSFNANVNGGANTLQNTAGASGYGKLVITGSLGNNTYNVTWAAGTNVFIVGFSAYNSATKEVSVLNMGRGGGAVAWLNVAWQGAGANAAVVNPDLVILATGINDWIISTPLDSYKSELATALAGLKTSTCDLLMWAPIQETPAGVSLAVQQTYQDAFKAAALSAGAVYLDTNRLLGGFTAANAQGWMASDGVHGSNYGYADIAGLMAGQVLLAV